MAVPIAKLRELQDPGLIEGFILGRLDGKADKKSKARYLAYADLRGVRMALNKVCGPGNWQYTIREASHEIGTGLAAVSSIGIRVDFGDGNVEWVYMDGEGYNKDKAQAKGAESDAGKRAGFGWGIFEALYDLSREKVLVEKVGSREYADFKDADRIVKKWTKQIKELHQQWVDGEYRPLPEETVIVQEGDAEAETPESDSKAPEPKKDAAPTGKPKTAEKPAEKAEDPKVEDNADNVVDMFNAKKIEEGEPHSESDDYAKLAEKAEQILNEVSKNRKANPETYEIVKTFCLGNGADKFSKKYAIPVLVEKLGEKLMDNNIKKSISEWVTENE